MNLQLVSAFFALALCLVIVMVWPQSISPYIRPVWSPPQQQDSAKAISLDEFYDDLRDHSIVDADLQGNDVRGHFGDGTAFVLHASQPLDVNAIRASLDNDRPRD